jgi:hypothetical protein
VRIITGVVAPPVRQVEVEQDEFVAGGVEGFLGGVEALHPVDAMAGGGHVVTHRLAQYIVVLDEQYSHCTLGLTG